MNMISENLDTPRTLCFTASLLSPFPWPACNNTIFVMLVINNCQFPPHHYVKCNPCPTCM